MFLQLKTASTIILKNCQNHLASMGGTMNKWQSGVTKKTKVKDNNSQHVDLDICMLSTTSQQTKFISKSTLLSDTILQHTDPELHAA